MYIFEVSFLYNQISSVISFGLLLPTSPVSDSSWIYIGGKKNLPLIFLVFALDGLSEMNKRQSVAHR